MTELVTEAGRRGSHVLVAFGTLVVVARGAPAVGAGVAAAADGGADERQLK